MIDHINMVRSITLAAIVIFTTTVSAQYYPDRGEWLQKPPGELGLDADRINEAVEFARANEYSGSKDMRIAIHRSFGYEPYDEIVGPTKERGGTAGMIVKDGYVCASWGDVRRVDMTFSVTKSYLSTVVGLAADRGLIRSVKDPVYHYVWDGTFDGDHNRKITWEHLLNQSSDWSGSLFGMPDWSDRPARDGELDDWKYRVLHEPGTFFKYNDVRVNLLAYATLQVWRKPLPQVLKNYIMDPIGASTTWRWYGYSSSWVELDGEKMQSVSGGGHSGGGLFISTMDHARFGLLFARRGTWKGQQLISEEWIGMATEPSPANESYGYLWWLNKGERAVEGVPPSAFQASGFGGNYIYVDPENDLVVVTRWLEPSRLKDFLNVVYRSIKK